MAKPWTLVIKDVPDDVRDIIFEVKHDLENAEKTTFSIRDTVLHILKDYNPQAGPDDDNIEFKAALYLLECNGSRPTWKDLSEAIGIPKTTAFRKLQVLRPFIGGN